MRVIQRNDAKGFGTLIAPTFHLSVIPRIIVQIACMFTCLILSVSLPFRSSVPFPMSEFSSNYVVVCVFESLLGQITHSRSSNSRFKELPALSINMHVVVPYVSRSTHARKPNHILHLTAHRKGSGILPEQGLECVEENGLELTARHILPRKFLVRRVLIPSFF